MDALVEFGTLPLGVVNAEGVRCREYALRPLRVKDSLAARRSPDMARAADDDNLLGLISFAARLDIVGVPREAVTLDFMLELFDEDLTEILEADERLKEKIARFRGEGPQAVDSGPAEAGDTLGAGAGNDAGGGAAVAGGLG